MLESVAYTFSVITSWIFTMWYYFLLDPTDVGVCGGQVPGWSLCRGDSVYMAGEIRWGAISAQNFQLHTVTAFPIIIIILWTLQHPSDCVSVSLFHFGLVCEIGRIEKTIDTSNECTMLFACRVSSVTGQGVSPAWRWGKQKDLTLPIGRPTMSAYSLLLVCTLECPVSTHRNTWPCLT